MTCNATCFHVARMNKPRVAWSIIPHQLSGLTLRDSDHQGPLTPKTIVHPKIKMQQKEIFWRMYFRFVTFLSKCNVFLFFICSLLGSCSVIVVSILRRSHLSVQVSHSEKTFERNLKSVFVETKITSKTNVYSIYWINIQYSR